MRPKKLKETTRPITIAVFGTGMDAGKTTCAAELVKGISRTGHKVGFGKLTGTGAFSDIHKPEDAGAIDSVDFVDMGYPSTYKLETGQILEILTGLNSYLTLRGADVTVIEVADGVFQSDNQKLLKSEEFKSKIDAVLLAADSGPAALAAANELNKHDITVLAVSGLLTNTPLSVSELETHVKGNEPKFGVLDLSELRKRATASRMIKSIETANPDKKYKTAKKSAQSKELAL